MYAIAVDGNVLATVQSKGEVVEKLKDKQIRDEAFFNADGKIEVGEGYSSKDQGHMGFDMYRIVTWEYKNKNL